MMSSFETPKMKNDSKDSIWIFGYGSLIWKPCFEWSEKRSGFICGFSRRFWQLSDDHRGVPDKPGRVVTLVSSDKHEARVWGVAYQLAGNIKDQRKIIAQLDHREQRGYKRISEIFHSRDCYEDTVLVTMYFAGPDNPHFSPHLGDITSLARQVFEAKGPSGSNTEYVLQLAKAIRELCPNDEPEDEHLFQLEKELLTMIENATKE